MTTKFLIDSTKMLGKKQLDIDYLIIVLGKEN